MKKLKDKIRKIYKKLKNLTIQAFASIIYAVLILYYVFRKKATPLKYKIIVAFALLYFIMPIDIIPDILIGGWLDDSTIIFFALTQVISYIDSDVVIRARTKTQGWFGLEADLSLVDSKIFKYKDK